MDELFSFAALVCVAIPHASGFSFSISVSILGPVANFSPAGIVSVVAYIYGPVYTLGGGNFYL